MEDKVSQDFDRGYERGELAGMSDVMLGVLMAVSEHSDLPREVWGDAATRAAEDFKRDLPVRERMRAHSDVLEMIWSP